jgi:methylase of polypeptide subunit release factors
LKSSATSFKYENGRRYHAQTDARKHLALKAQRDSDKSAEYFLPNDDVRTLPSPSRSKIAQSWQIESDRLDLFHHLLTLRCDDRLHFAPIGPEPKRILDLGTGTGIWAIQMGMFLP